MLKTYVYDGKEVVLTGRVAKQKPRREGAKVRSDNDLFEIRPFDVDEANKSFNKWVKMNQLHEVVE